MISLDGRSIFGTVSPRNLRAHFWSYHMSTSDTHTKNVSGKKLALLTLAALGVVYGDIGTSPLYAMNEIFFGHAHIERNPVGVLGAVSTVFWALTLIICLKYVFLVLRADKDGEGGVFALYSLFTKVKSRSKRIMMPLFIISAGLLFGDGMITPAISVISAIEGLKVVTTSLEPYIVPITITILTGLFVIQKNGTAKVGSLFGPIVTIWFVSIAFVGLSHILNNPEIFKALNPLYAINFLRSHNFLTVLYALGSVMLVVTGGEAMYADMGHFGRRPIRLSWFSLVYPCLILNYLGQGAFLLSGSEVVGHNIFYSMVPSWGLIPMLILATCATIIASQAMISGAFSITVQAVQLGLLPYIKIKHTHHEHEGQTYVPVVNWMLYAGCILLVIIFKSSSNLASAYGLAVSGDMLITALALVVISQKYWKWSLVKAALIFAPFLLIDISFLMANSLKFFSGGYIPLSIGLVILALMQTWKWGKKHISTTFSKYPSMTVKKLVMLKKDSTQFIPRSIIILTRHTINSVNDTIPTLKQLFWERYGLLPKHLVFLHIRVTKNPHNTDDRYDIYKFYDDPKLGSITSVILKFGFMEELEVEKALEGLAAHDKVNIPDNHRDWLIHSMHERILNQEFDGILDTLRFNLFRFIQKFAMHADQYFGLGKDNRLTIEVVPVNLK